MNMFRTSGLNFPSLCHLLVLLLFLELILLRMMVMMMEVILPLLPRRGVYFINSSKAKSVWAAS